VAAAAALVAAFAGQISLSDYQAVHDGVRPAWFSAAPLHLVDDAYKFGRYHPFFSFGALGLVSIQVGALFVQRVELGTIGAKPLVVLVNRYTASASEITSGALQDYHLAKLIGTKTFGKGVVQSIYPMPDDGALKITTAKYVTPLGRDIQHKGIMPDIVVPQSEDPALIDTAADKQLAAAKAQLRHLLH